MKKIIFLAIFAIFANVCLSQDKNLAGMYESTSNSYWVSLNENGTGKLMIYADWLNWGTRSFTWRSDRDQVFVEFNPNETAYFDWFDNNGVIYLGITRMGGNELVFIKTR